MNKYTIKLKKTLIIEQHKSRDVVRKDSLRQWRSNLVVRWSDTTQNAAAWDGAEARGVGFLSFLILCLGLMNVLRYSSVGKRATPHVLYIKGPGSKLSSSIYFFFPFSVRSQHSY
jgi:hypothetical protein